MNKWIAGALVVGLFGCGTPEGEDSASNGIGAGQRVSLPDGFGKSDNYIATNASEFILQGTATFPLPEGFEELSEEDAAATLQEIAEQKTADVTRAARKRIDELLKVSNDELREQYPDIEEDELLKYFIYVKSAYSGGETYSVLAQDGVGNFDFAMELVGSLELISLVDGEVADEMFEVEFEGQTVPVRIVPSPSSDSFPKYDELFADGIYDISIIFGGDYNEERYDIETAKWTVDYLFETGWKNSAVSTFEELRHDSPPFTMPLVVEGKEVEARVYIVHAQMDDDAGVEQQILRDRTVEAMANHDVIIYSGHAGANAGMILDYHPRYEIDDDEFADLALSPKYQIYVFDGCNSYRTYVDKLMLNPMRTWDNTTAVTTVNTTPFSAGYEIIERFVHWLTFTDVEGTTHFPVSWNTLLQGVNANHPDVYYGVHGIDQDPKLNPHGGEGLACSSCDTNEDCGAGANYCLNLDGGAACGIACTDSRACGDGFACEPIVDDPELFYIPRQCVPTNLTCGG